MTAERDRERQRLVSGPSEGPGASRDAEEPESRRFRPSGVQATPCAPAGWVDCITASHLAPTPQELERLRRVAEGQQDADLVVRGGRLVVVHSGELRLRDLYIAGRFIAAVTRPGILRARRALDATGRYILPAYVNSYLQVERTLVTPGELARLVVPRGTVTLLTDVSALVALCGPRGGQLVTTTRTPVRLIAGCPLPTPALPAVGVPDATGRVPHQQHPLAATPAEGLLLPPVSGPPATFSGCVQRTEVESQRTEDDDAWDALMDRSRRRTVADLEQYGDLDRDVRRAVEAGIEPMTAIRMATLKPARRYGLDHLLGSLVPGHLADIQIVRDIAGSRPPEIVLAGGRMAAEGGRALFDNLDLVPRWACERVTLPPGLHSGSFAVPTAATGRPVTGVRVSAAADGVLNVQIVPMRPLASDDVAGHLRADPDHDVLKVALVTRSADRAPGVRVGFLQGVGLLRGAIGMTTSVAPGHLALIGATDHDMMTAARALEGMGGGFVVVDRGWVLAACPLPVAGVMSDAHWEAVRDQLAGAESAAAAIGCRLRSPFLALAPLGARLCDAP